MNTREEDYLECIGCGKKIAAPSNMSGHSGSDWLFINTCLKCWKVCYDLKDTLENVPFHKENA